MQSQTSALTLLTLASLASSSVIPRDLCDVSFQKDVFTHSRHKNRALRIKMIQNQASFPCNLQILLPSNQTVVFNINGDAIDVVNLPAIYQDKIQIKRSRSSPDTLLLEVTSLEEESRSGMYIISGHPVFGIQTPPSRGNTYSQVENITCENKKLRGTVALSPQFSLCQRYNRFVGNDSYLRYDIQNVDVIDGRIHFIAVQNDMRFQVVEVFCDIMGGDGVKVYKVKFILDTQQCPVQR